MNDQDAPGAAPETQIKVFISYKTREHARYVDEISAVLRAAGFDIWYDEERKVPPLRTFGLDISLQSGLDESDAMLVLLPREPAPEPTTWQQLKDNADTWINFGYFAIGGIGFGLGLVMTIYWNKFWYGIDLAKSNKESWQDWERRIGQDFGLTIVHATIQEDSTETVIQPDVCLLHSDHLQDDLLQQAIPRLRMHRRAGHRPPMSADKQQLYRLLPILLVIIYVVLSILVALEWIKNAILWLPRQIAKAARRVRSRLNR